MEMGQLVHALSSSRNDYMPVLNENGDLLGEIDITNSLYHFPNRALSSLSCQSVDDTSSGDIRGE